MAFDVASVRGLFPALGDGWVHLDAPEGMAVIVRTAGMERSKPEIKREP